MKVNLNSYRGFLGLGAFPKYWNALLEGNFLLGTFSSDHLMGSERVDVILGFSGDDLLSGQGGNDLLRGGLGSDRLDGGTGSDTADYTRLLRFDSAFGIDVNLSAGTVLERTAFGPEMDRIANVEVIIGTASNDRFIGDGNDNIFIGNFERGTEETPFVDLEGNSYSVTGDVAEYTGVRQDFLLRGTADHFSVLGGETGIDTLIDVEFLKFNETLLSTGEIGFLPAPAFDEVTALAVKITADGRLADVYFPADGKDLPVVILLQGANVDQSNYSTFASTVASYGFTVVVSNQFRTLTIAPGIDEPGLFASVNQIGEIVDYLPTSPVADLVDTNNVLLAGHSFGGAAGLTALQGLCQFPFCTTEPFELPEAVRGGAFYGTNFVTPSGVTPLVSDFPIALIAGSKDGVSTPQETQLTFDSLLAPASALVSVAGANHYGITNENNPSNPADVPPGVPPAPEPDLIDPTLPQAVATETIAFWSALFFQATLGDAAATDFIFNGVGDGLDPNVEVTDTTATSSPLETWMSRHLSER